MTALKSIKKSASAIHKKIMKRQKPSMRLPIRALNNVRYKPSEGFFEMSGKKRNGRSLSAP